MENIKKAYFAGGCFWCMAKPYNTVEGVIDVEVGYCGGKEDNPTYEQVKHQETGHRETVLISYDPTKLSYKDLLEVYFYNIDPFDDGGQFIDRGHSYSCAIYYNNDEEKELANSIIAKIEKEYSKKVCVEVCKLDKYFKAEEYHQDYALKNKEAYKEEYESSGRASRKEEDKVKIK